MAGQDAVLRAHRGQRRPARLNRKSFWTLVLIALLATGALSTALKAHPSPTTGATVAISGTVLAISFTLATRILLAVDRARPHRPATTAPLTDASQTPAGLDRR